MTYDEALSTLKEMPAATVWEAAGKKGDLSPAIKPMFPGARVAGPAFTVKMFPGETFAIVRAIDAAPVGSVIVIDAGAAQRGSSWGGTSTFAALRKGLNGVVTNGPIRDTAEVIERQFPVFATGSSLVAGLRGHQGWIAIPIAIGEVVVRPGDFVVGDLDGVTVVPAEDVVAVAALAIKRRAEEIERERRVVAGEKLTDVLRIG